MTINKIISLLRSDELHMDQIYQPKMQCPICLMDSSDPRIVIKKDGCNHCKDASKGIIKNAQVIEKTKDVFWKNIENLKKNKTPIIIGLSGGVDSSYLALRLWDLGLNIKAIHVDNHWNTAEASNNIQKLVTSLNLDFTNYVLKWDSFRALQISLLNADVVDLENVSDHAIFSCLFKESRKHGNAKIFHGVNYNSENIMPSLWLYNKHDKTNLKAIYRASYPFEDVENLDYPFMGNLEVIFNKRIRGITWLSALDYLDYNKETAEVELQNRIGYERPKRKHEESTITKIYQRLILPVKFGIDKRKAHLSSIIVSNQLTREKGVELLKEPLYKREELLYDLNFFLNKLGIGETEFIHYLIRERQEHDSFKNEMWIKRLIDMKNNIF